MCTTELSLVGEIEALFIRKTFAIKVNIVRLKCTTKTTFDNVHCSCLLTVCDTVLQVLFGRISSQETMNLLHIVSLKVCCHSHSGDDDDEIIINVNCKYAPCPRTKN